MAGEGDAERLVVLLEARVADFEKRMNKASGTATREFNQMRKASKAATAQMEADMVRSTNRINQALAATGGKIGAFGHSFAGGLAAPLAGLLSLTSAIHATKAALDKFGTINDQSLAAGMDPEFFQAIAYQAKLSGVEIDGLAGAMATFATNSGLAAEGKGRMVSTLQALNPELLKSIQAATTQEERFKLVADALRDAKDQAHAAAIASAAFGDAGTALVAAFKGGADEIERMMAKAEEMGLIVDRSLIARADELGDEFDTTSQIIDLKLKESFVNLGPPLLYLTGLVADWTSALAIVLDQYKEIEQRAYINPLQNQLVAIENTRAGILEHISELETDLAEQDPNGGFAGQLRGELEQANASAEALMQKALILQNRIAELQGMPSTVTPPAMGAPADPREALYANMSGRGVLPIAKPFYTPGGGTAGAGGGSRIVSDTKEWSDLLKAGKSTTDKIDDAMKSISDLALDAGESLVDAFKDGKLEAGEILDIVGDIVKQLLSPASGGGNLLTTLFSTFGGGSGAAGVGAAASAAYGSVARGFASGTGNTGGMRGEPRGIVHGQEAVIPLPSGGKVPVQVQSGKSDPMNIRVDVGVTVDQTGNLQAYVQRVTQETASRTIQKSYSSQDFFNHTVRAVQNARKRMNFP